MRSGRSRATFRELSPIDPVEPSTTTFLGRENSDIWVRPKGSVEKKEVKIKDRCRENDRVNEVEKSADARHNVAAVFHGETPLDDGFGEIAQHGDECDEQPENPGMDVP